MPFDGGKDYVNEFRFAPYILALYEKEEGKESPVIINQEKTADWL